MSLQMQQALAKTQPSRPSPAQPSQLAISAQHASSAPQHLTWVPGFDVIHLGVHAERQVGGQGPGGGGPRHQAGAVLITINREADHDRGVCSTQGNRGRRRRSSSIERRNKDDRGVPQSKLHGVGKTSRRSHYQRRQRQRQEQQLFQGAGRLLQTCTHTPLTRHILVVLPRLKVGERGGAAGGVGHHLQQGGKMKKACTHAVGRASFAAERLPAGGGKSR